jgi:hypothetical protein
MGRKNIVDSREMLETDKIPPSLVLIRRSAIYYVRSLMQQELCNLTLLSLSLEQAFPYSSLQTFNVILNKLILYRDNSTAIIFIFTFLIIVMYFILYLIYNNYFIRKYNGALPP